MEMTNNSHIASAKSVWGTFETSYPTLKCKKTTTRVGNCSETENYVTSTTNVSLQSFYQLHLLKIYPCAFEQ
jgi:hypothetical protein